ncbi:Snf7-domain-containing protein [Fusarium redolens]|uniref:Snf7-domain-containing protein n=1 Tax=Fusarium redolens TaxID=48865 RepID=A0A9P9GK90_FUSRE|nr:Snf7-domain-containing protein [Fusarium redolens]KAH7241173.1 Snf7-domain-containing protein [Fusarium redolens]
MGELADYLIHNDPSFSRSRLAARYSDFRSQRSLNPDGYQANISAWRQALSDLVAKGKISHRGSSPDHFVLKLDDSLLRSLEYKEFGQPLALGTVVREATAGRDFIPLQDFEKSQQSIYQRSWAGLPWSVMSWTLRQLGVVDPARGDDKLPTGQYVIVKNMEAAAKELGDLMAEKVSRFDRVFSRAQFQKAFSAALVQGQHLTDSDLDVLLKFLSRDKEVIEYDGKTIRIKGSGEQGGITKEDAAIASLKELTESLKHQADLLNTRIDELSQTAKDAVTKKNRVAALAALKSKKIAETSLATRYATLNQLEEVSAKLEQAADNVQLVNVMEASSGALASLNAQVGGAERVDAVMDRLREQSSATDEVSAILAESTGEVIDETALDDELEAMEAQEREKEEEKTKSKEAEEQKARDEQEAAEAQKKLDELPDVPADGEEIRQKEQTPTSETGIANLAI